MRRQQRLHQATYVHKHQNQSIRIGFQLQQQLSLSNMMSSSVLRIVILLLVLIVLISDDNIIQPSNAASQRSRISHVSPTFVTTGKYTNRYVPFSTSFSLQLAQIRGGSTNSDNDDVKESSDIAINENASMISKSKVTSSLPPLSIMLQTNVGSTVIDQVLELPMVNRQRTILSIKQSIQRQLPCKPPISSIQLIYQGQVITDDNLKLLDIVDEDDDDDDDDDDDADNNDRGGTDTTKQIKMYIDMIPPIDPKSYIYDIESKINDLSTIELLHAYTTNEAAIYYNTQQILRSTNSKDDDINTEQDEHHTSVSMNLKIRERATQIEKDLNATVLNTRHARKLLSDIETPHQREMRLLASNTASAIEVRGERIRHNGIHGIRGNYKRIIQRELNIEDWYMTTKHCLLFLFFGYFGGRTLLSRTVLLLGAPILLLCQTRFMKFYLRQLLFTILNHPPSIILSLLPAPQQAILSLHVKDSIKSLYGDHIIVDETMKQLFHDDPVPSDSALSILTSKRFTATMRSSDADEEEDDEDVNDGDDDDDDSTGEDDEDDE